MIEKQTDVTTPHGAEQNIKMELLRMIHRGENPFDIICHLAKYLEKASDESGYADHVRKDIRAIYGLALLDKKLLADEQRDTEERLARIQASYDTGDFTEEERQRIRFAIDLHRKNIERLRERIREAEISGSPSYTEKG